MEKQDDFGDSEVMDLSIYEILQLKFYKKKKKNPKAELQENISVQHLQQIL